MKKHNLNITIFGIGAMGTLFGSYLDSVANVSLFGNWLAQIEAIQRNGLKVTEPDGRQSHHRRNLLVTNNLSQISPADLVLILVKSHQTEQIAKQVATILRADGIVITLQNGLGNLEKLAKVIGWTRTALGVTAQGATVISPGHLHHAGKGVTHLALVPGLKKQLEHTANLFNEAGLETIVVDDADSLTWGKLAINAGINPLTALLEIPNGMLMKDELLRQIAFAAANEVAQVAAAQGIRLPFVDVASQIAQVSRATANNYSSMLQDIRRSAPTEIEAISGTVLRFGKRFGVPTPVNEFLRRGIIDKETGRLAAADTLDRLKIEFYEAAQEAWLYHY